MTITKKSIFFSGIILLIILLILFSEKSEAATLSNWTITDEVSTDLTHDFSEYIEDVFNTAFDEDPIGRSQAHFAVENGKFYCVENIWVENEKEKAFFMYAQRLQVYDCNTKEKTTTYYYSDTYVDDIFVSGGKLVFFYSEHRRIGETDDGKAKYNEVHFASVAKEDGTLLKGICLEELYDALKDSVRDNKVYYEGATERFIAASTDGMIAVTNKFGNIMTVYQGFKNEKIQFLFSTKEGELVFKSSGNSNSSTVFFFDESEMATLDVVSFYFNKVLQSFDGNIIYRTYPDESFVRWNLETGERVKFLSTDPTYIQGAYVTTNDLGEVFVLKGSDLRVFSDKAKKPTVIKVQKCGEWDNNLDRAMKKYESSHPDVKFEFITVGGKELDEQTRLQATIESLKNGTGADIISISPDSFDTFYDAGVVKDISDYVSEEEKDSLFKGFLEASSKDGKIYMYPSFNARETLGAKKGTFSGNSYTATDLLKLLEKKEKEGKPYKALCYGAWNVDPFFVFSHAMDESEFLNLEERTCSFDSDVFIRILKQCKKYYTDKNISPASLEARANALMNDEVPLILIDNISISDFDEYMALCGDKLEMPGFPTTAESGNVTTYYRALAVGKNTKNYNQIKDFLKYLNENEWGDYSLTFIPSNKKFYDGKIINGTNVTGQGSEFPLSGKVELEDGYKELVRFFSSPNPTLILGGRTFYEMTAKEDGTSYLDEFIAFFDSMRLSDRSFTPIEELMYKEVDKMYKQNISEKETAANIQKKVSEYLSNLQ